MRIPRVLRLLAVLARVCLVALALEALGQTGTGAPAASVQAAGGSIEGHVVLTATNKPLDGVDISVANARVPPLKSDANGRFLFERLAAGRFKAPGFPSMNGGTKPNLGQGQRWPGPLRTASEELGPGNRQGAPRRTCISGGVEIDSQRKVEL